MCIRDSTKRVASAEDLNLMLMRSSRAQKVTRRGVHLDIAGQRIDYWNDDLVFNYLGQQVYYRYDPDDLSEVRVYDLQDRFIMTVPADNTAVLTYGASKEEVKEAIAKVRRKMCIRDRCKLETFPVEIVRQVEGMMAEMQEQQNLNFSMIARFCTIHGHTISSPAVKTYFLKHFSEG